jgi:ABC-type nitrate/sulfonate/bicarbonate transport system permease component
MSARSRRWVGNGLEVAVPLAVLVIWGVTSAGSTSFYFPPLTEILTAFADNWLFERIGSDAVPSLLRMGAGLLIAIAIAVSAGLVLGMSRRARIATAPVIEFLRAIPPPALLPFAILVIGVGNGMKVAIIAFVCIWPILLNVIDGVTGIDPTLRETAQAYRIGRRDYIRSVLVPAASPQIFAGLRVSLSLALIMMVVSEMVASTNGIGYFVLQAQRTFAIPEMWSGIILLGILGYGLNAIFTLLERRVLGWHRGARASALG